MSFRLGLALILVFASFASCARDPFTTLVAYEAKQRLSAQVDEKQYHLFPFKISQEPQHFLHIPETDQIMNVEVAVHWIDENSTLRFPTFNLSQKVRITIEESSSASLPTKPFLKKQFLTQTGFKLNMTSGKNYRWKVETMGIEIKLVEIAISTKKISEIPQENIQTKTHQEQMKILEQMSQLLNKVKMQRSEHDIENDSNVSDMWAWMSGVEMLSLVLLVLVQLAYFQKISFPSSIV